jgi:MFS family permease
VLQDTLRVPPARLANAAFWAIFAANAAGAACSLLGGALSDRIGKRKPIYATGAALLALGLIVQVTGPTMTTFLLGCLVAGVGFGLLNGLMYALAAETSGDPATSARDMGLVNVAITLPYAIIPFLAPLILSSGGGNNYAALYFLCALGTALAIPVLRCVRGVR